MASLPQPSSSEDGWTEYESRIRIMVRERLSKMMGQSAQTSDYEDNVIREIQKRFVPTDRSDQLWRIPQSDPLWIPSVVTEEVNSFVVGKQLDLWSVHEAFVAAAFKAAFPPATRGLDKEYVDFLFSCLFKHFCDRFSEYISAGNVEEWLREFTKQVVDAEIMNTVSDRRLADETKQFLEERRRELRNLQIETVLPLVRGLLPSAAQEFQAHYVPILLEQVLTRIGNRRDTRSSSPEWLKATTEWLIEPSIRKLTYDDGELRDEELVMLFRAGNEKCRTMLLERYATKLHQLVPRIVYAKNICPESEDPTEFAKDIAQQVSVKLLQQLDSYRFESSFETWVGTICENEANTKQRAILGRSKQGTRKYLSFDELKEKSATPPVLEDLARREILHKVLGKHRLQGPRALKSTKAIELRHFDGMETTAIAEALRTSRAYVDQLFSHDYPQLRKILVEDFGLSGTDL